MISVTKPDKPVGVLDHEHHLTISLHLLNVHLLMPYQGLVVLPPWHNVDRIPQARPALEAAELHVELDDAGGGFDLHAASSASTLAISI